MSTEDEIPVVSGIGQRRANALDEDSPGYRERRQHIIDSAMVVFKRSGYQATKLADIASEAGLDRATLYYYFSGKAALFDEMVSGAVEANARLAEDVRASDRPAPEKLRSLVEALMASYAEHYPCLYIFVQENLAHVAPERVEWARRMRQLNHRYEDALIGIVRDGIEEGTLRATGDPKIMAYGLLGMLGWTSRWFNPETSPQSAGEIARTFVDTLLSGIVTRTTKAEHAA